MTPGVIVKKLSEVTPLVETCGSSTRMLTARDGTPAGFHVTAITHSRLHYHRSTDEIYYILSGGGQLRVGDEVVALEPGVLVFIPAGVPHAAEGDLTTVIVPVPPLAEPNDIVEVEEG